MHPLALIPISLLVASGVWFYICGAKAGFRLPMKIVLFITGSCAFLFGQYGVKVFWKTFFYDNFMYLLRNYPDAYQILAQFLITFVLVLIIGKIIQSIFVEKDNDTDKSSIQKLRMTLKVRLIIMIIGIVLIITFFCIDSDIAAPISALAIIPLFIVFVSMFAISFWEPILGTIVFHVVACTFYSLLESLINFKDFLLLLVVAFGTMVLGCIATYFGKKFRAG